MEFTSYVIKDNKLYYNCHGRCAGYAEDFTEYLNGIVENNILKDTMFYICANEGIDYNNNQKWRDEPHTLDLVENVQYIMGITRNPSPIVEEVGHAYLIVDLQRIGVTRQIV